MNGRLEYVDIAKGMGIVLVVCSHSDALGLMWLFMGMFVPIFYFCAGYTFTMKGTLKDSMKKRFRKLFVPYVFFNLLLFVCFLHFSLRELLGMFYSRYCLYPLDVEPNVKFLTSGNYPMWFLTSMILSYLFFYLIVYHEKYRYAFIVVYALVTQAFVYSPILLPWSLDTAFLTALFMYAGMMARCRDAMAWSGWAFLLMAVLYVALHLVAGDMNLSVRMYGHSFVSYFLLGTMGSLLVMKLSMWMQQTWGGRLFLLLGRHSLTIFCIQILFIFHAKSLFAWLFPGGTVGYLAGIFEIVAALVGGLLVSLLIHRSRLLSRLLL